MRTFLMALAAGSLVLPATFVSPLTTTKAEARKHRRYAYREYRGENGRYYCRRHGGLTGAVVGGVAGGLLGNAILGGTGGTLVGAAGGALGGRAIERGENKRRCR